MKKRGLKFSMYFNIKLSEYRIIAEHFFLITVLLINAFVFTQNRISFFIQLSVVFIIIIHHFIGLKFTKQLSGLAHYDMLTMLPNRYKFMYDVEKLFSVAKRGKLSFALIFFDLDGFKNINDTFGHKYGDEILKKVADIVKQTFLRSNDAYCRLGGDEFLIFTIPSNFEYFEKFLNILLEKINNIKIKDNFKIGVSIGAVYVREPAKNLKLENFIKTADKIMYEVKKTGKNGYLIKII